MIYEKEPKSRIHLIVVTAFIFALIVFFVIIYYDPLNTQTDYNTTLNDTQLSEIRQGCIDLYFAPAKIQKDRFDCFDTVCGMVGFEYHGESSYYMPIFKCRNNTQPMEFNLYETEALRIESCYITEINFLKNRYCIDIQEAGF